MHDIPLNDTQRFFAEKNHNLVYKFLHEKNLPASEYYDIIIFGYLRAVQRYLTDPNLAGYSFATVAWRAMEGEIVNAHRTARRRFRVIRFVRPRQTYIPHFGSQLFNASIIGRCHSFFFESCFLSNFLKWLSF